MVFVRLEMLSLSHLETIMEVETLAESSVSPQETVADRVEKKPDPASGNKRAAKKRPQFMLPMADIPSEKKTSSRAGIKRTVSLKSRNTQDVFFRTYSFLSAANYFLEIVAPGIASTHPDKPEHAALVRQFQELTRDTMKSVKESVAEQTQMVREAMENNGIDPDPDAMVFTEPLSEEAVITSQLDSEFLSLLESVDMLVGLRGLGSIFSVFSPDEMSAMERSLRREILSVYRTSLRNSRIAMQAAMGRYRPRPVPDAAGTATTEATEISAPDLAEPPVPAEASEPVDPSADASETPTDPETPMDPSPDEGTEESHPRKRGSA